MLFHYHFWTPYVEETEKFYEDNGFRISQRIGRYQGEFQEFNPPLKWEDFREKNILFRIIEARKGTINITFGYGKRIMFDHIGFLVSDKEREKICENAVKLSWKVDKRERRTFISTPYHFRIELQTNTDVVDSLNSKINLQELKLETKKAGLESDLLTLFGTSKNRVYSEIGDVVTIKQAIINNLISSPIVDPNGVRIINE
ncbi:hypothetical protein MXL46_17700 [Heyndrickxia sporothermodurans]|uniref:Uncharacterized protein n=2 Tax=Heyndrickxia TaxID=2837504 RepID=A0A150KS96_9BACI|nr:hypothetical protein [Heyndrickxia sporothermodurans]KYD02680.1 hypothetical protein B4102_0275 [Heyndrickxia sporothermodurans]MEB6550897.1 hypothetical protein [Heyndrickxia sporothermodurans]MED3651951.1 hypothetical protein [Heyndrickxia sporothermodurans]MED3655279.1 hypothetical protein [Heyndrickxia sporothermodurans]MED3698293.1 hypothetical protein [Heyndrickxia sporothermodurans]